MFITVKENEYNKFGFVTLFNEKNISIFLACGFVLLVFKRSIIFESLIFLKYCSSGFKICDIILLLFKKEEVFIEEYKVL